MTAAEAILVNGPLSGMVLDVPDDFNTIKIIAVGYGEVVYSRSLSPASAPIFVYDKGKK